MPLTRDAHSASAAGDGAAEASPPGVTKRLLAHLAGPRLVDAPARTLLVTAIAVAIVAAVLQHGDARTVSLLSLVVGASVIAAQTLSHLRVDLFLTLSAVVLSAQVLAHVAISGADLGIGGGVAPGAEPAAGFSPVVAAWTFGALLGLAFAWVEVRTRREVQRYRQAAHRTRDDLDRLRLSLALDTHDTVSHGLAAESAIIRMIGAESRAGGAAHSRLTELALVNAHTQQQLRLLLDRLTANPGRPGVRTDVEELLHHAADTVRSAAEAGGFDLELRVSSVPRTAPAGLVEPALFVIKELATNIVKHAASPRGCSIEIGLTEDGDHGQWLRLQSQNAVERQVSAIPQSLSARAAALGGVCRARCEGGRYTVVVLLPVPNITALDTSNERCASRPG